ncbi:hypothetical protein BTVI_98749 [Pitangus sulphuratus]|nr:hypothetical protein BTVI_98749 [Pitangus sulphuratus]
MLGDMLGDGIQLSVLSNWGNWFWQWRGAGDISGGQEVPDPEDKRLKNAWEAPWVGVTFAAGLAVSVAGYGMDEAEQDQYEARLKELFDSFDSTGTGSLGQEELTDLCHMLHLEEVAPALQQTLLQGNLLGRVHFDQFKEALILILSRTLSNEEHFQEPDQTGDLENKLLCAAGVKLSGSVEMLVFQPAPGSGKN